LRRALVACSTLGTLASAVMVIKDAPVPGASAAAEESATARSSWETQLKSTAARESCQPMQAGGKVVLVTGTGGFIGYSTALRLRQRGDGVLGLDNFNSYYPVNLKQARAAELEKAGVVTIHADLNEEAALKEAMDLCNFTHVLHLAAQAGVRYAIKDPHSYVASNVKGFVSILEAVRSRDPMPPVVYASSSSVYGLNTKVPFSEADPVDHPASLYAATKRENELMAHTYNHVFKMALTGLRFFTVYGPYGRPDMAAFNFANKIMQGETVKIFTGPGGSELERDFTFVDDIARGCIAAVDNIGASGVEGAPLKVYNLGNENPENVTYLVDLLEENLGKKAVRKYMPMPATGDVLRTSANVSLARADLGYSPTTSLRDGIQKFIAWYKDYYKDGLDIDMMRYQGFSGNDVLDRSRAPMPETLPGLAGVES